MKIKALYEEKKRGVSPSSIEDGRKLVSVGLGISPAPVHYQIAWEGVEC